MESNTALALSPLSIMRQRFRAPVEAPVEKLVIQKSRLAINREYDRKNREAHILAPGRLVERPTFADSCDKE